MPNEPISAAAMVVLAAVAASLVTLLRLFAKHIDGRPLLNYEPRRPVPWNGAAPLLLLTLIFAVALIAPEMADPAGDGQREAAEQLPSAAEMWTSAGFAVALAGGIYFALAALFRADRADLGFPRSLRQFLGDLRIGAVACLAGLLPLYIVQLALMAIFEPTTHHPLLEQLIEDPSPGVVAAAVFAACVVAPVLEETVFRLVLQGWLERRTAAPSQPLLEIVAVHEDNPDAVVPSMEVVAAPDVAATERAVPGDTPTRWGPILATAVLFGLAHWGQGVAPASLIVLGVVLGYVYQRTHRIVPSMACHALFNGLSLTVFFLS